MSLKELHIEPISCRIGVPTGNHPGGEDGEDEHGGDDPDGEGLVEELPGGGDVVVPAYVGDEEVGEVEGGERDAGGAEAGAQPDRPLDRVAVLLLRRPRHLQQRPPQLLPLPLPLHGGGGGHLGGGGDRLLPSLFSFCFLQARDQLRRRREEERETMRERERERMGKD